MGGLYRAVAVVAACAATAGAQDAKPASPGQEQKPFKQEVPSAAYAIEMVPVPGDAAKKIKPYWISRTEVTWEAFDVYVYKLDEGGSNPGSGAPPSDSPQREGKPEDKDSPKPDAVTRPTKPYLPPDRGFGHEGYAAISLSHENAAEFCKWLSAKSGRKFRLATEDEWELACGAAPVGKDLAEAAWFADNAEDKPHAVGKKKANTLGIYDMLGNVSEWVDGRDGKPVVKGGNFRDAAEALKTEARQPMNRAWNASDPQIPKSKWWLSDGPFIGFRIVCEAEETGAKPATTHGDESRLKKPDSNEPRTK